MFEFVKGYRFTWPVIALVPGMDKQSEVKFTGMVTPKTKLVEYGIDFKRVMRGRLVLGIADGWMKADGEVIYKATDLRVGLFQEKQG